MGTIQIKKIALACRGTQGGSYQSDLARIALGFHSLGGSYPAYSAPIARRMGQSGIRQTVSIFR